MAKQSVSKTKRNRADRTRSARPGSSRRRAAELTKARQWIEAKGGLPSFDILLKRLKVASAKLDLVRDSFGDLEKVDTALIGSAVVTAEVAEEIDDLWSEFDGWARTHTEAVTKVQS